MFIKYVFFLSFLFSSFAFAKLKESLSESSFSDISTYDSSPEPQYDYFDEEYIKYLISNQSRYVLVATGWSESSLGKMNAKNAQKQKRSFPMSYLLADKINNMGGEAMIIYQTTARINRNYRKYLYYTSHKYELQNLNEEEISKKVKEFEKKSFRINLLAFKNRDKQADDPVRYLYNGKNAYTRIKVPKILNRLNRKKFARSTMVGFTAHFSGPNLEKHAKSWNLPYLVNPSAQAYRIKKSQSRQSFRDADVRHPRGSYEPSFSKEDLAKDIYTLLMEIDFPKIVLKLDESAGGYGNKVMKFNDFNKSMSEEEAYDMIMARLNDVEKFPPPFIERIEEENGGAIVEEFIVGEDFSSPASVYMITGENQVSIRYTYDQLLGGVDNQDFKGSLGPIPLLDDESSNIVLMSERIGEHLSRQGVRGNVGTDFVIITNEYGERLAYAIENNVRNTGTSYPYNALKMLVGEEVLKTKFMKAFDDVKVPLISIKSYLEKVQELFYAYLRNHPLSFDKTTAIGCLVHHDTFSVGKIGAVCVADSLSEASEMFDEFSENAVLYLENLDEYQEYINIISLNEKHTQDFKPNSTRIIKFELSEDMIEETSSVEDYFQEKRVTFVNY